MLCKKLSHPDCKTYEYYIGNFTLSDFENIHFETKRIGELELSSEGKPLKGEEGVNKAYPVFVDRGEILSARHSPDYWGRVFFEEDFQEYQPDKSV